MVLVLSDGSLWGTVKRMPDSINSAYIQRALTLIKQHPAVCGIENYFFDDKNRTAIVDVVFKINLPNSWKSQGKSPSGVREKEIVRFLFPKEYPLIAPEPSLRSDFSRNMAHIQPWLSDNRPVPCIYDGDLSELLQQNGLAAILNQTITWLDRAAMDTLIDPNQGWEPVRRDTFENYLVADAEALRAIVNRRGGYKFFCFNYCKVRKINKGDDGFLYGELTNQSPQINKSSVLKIFLEKKISDENKIFSGNSLALVVWPGKKPSGDLIINDTYLPETVQNITQLIERTKIYGCSYELKCGFDLLKNCISKCSKAGPFTLAIFVLVRRPFNIIGSKSSIELCPYVLDIYSPELFIEGNKTPVKPAVHRHKINRKLLAQISGTTKSFEEKPWILMGAGSLGSKLAISLARAGHGPRNVIDKSVMVPHNAARHALTLSSNSMQYQGSFNKADLLCDALAGLAQPAIPLVEDVLKILQSKGETRRIFKRTATVVNATASLVVREALASTAGLCPRVIETTLFAAGQIGMITVEGPERNPNAGDLISEFYYLIQLNEKLSSILFNSETNGLSRQIVGEGCGSMTMVMSDGRLSLFAAAMSEFLLKRQNNELTSVNGEVLVSQLTDEGLGLQWQIHNILPVTKIQTANSNWKVRINQRVIKKIKEEISRWPQVETGGVLIGRVSESSRTFYVVDVMDAPEDSQRSENEFVLGIKGLRPKLENYSKMIDWSLYCLGTWHSHISPSGPSCTDVAVAKTLSIARPAPSILLVSTPAGFHALLADADDQLLEGGFAT